MRPNIFRIATKELSQDGFFTWLLQWSDNSNSQYDINLYETAKDFVRLLLDKPSDFQIGKVKASRQWNHIDICVEINDDCFIVIEDKKNSGEHSGQLERYKKIAADHYGIKGYKLVFIYLKTGNESLSTLKKVVDKGYSIIDRKAILGILNKRVVRNEIFGEFKEYLNHIDQATNSFIQFENITSNWNAAEGLYQFLQESLSEWSDWNYVPNQTGGFLGFFYHWNSTNEIGEIYIQIENAFERGIKLVIKIGRWSPKTDTLYRLLNEIKVYARDNRLTLIKPNKYRAGATSTLAIIENAFIIDNEGKIKLEELLRVLKLLEKTIDNYCKERNLDK